jgi:hypothetical protein
MKALMLFLVLGVQVVSAADLVCGDLAFEGVHVKNSTEDAIAVDYYGFKSEQMSQASLLASFEGKKKSIVVGGIFSKTTYELTSVNGVDEKAELTIYKSLFVGRAGRGGRGGRGGDDDTIPSITKSVQFIYEDKTLNLQCQ